MPGETHDHPPLAPLLEIGARLDRAGLSWALGGSGLLLALSLVDRANDWDVTCDVPAEVVEAEFADLPHASTGNNGVHADQKLMFEPARTELICRFAFFTPGGIVHLPTIVRGRWNGVPLASAEVWATAYALMGELESSKRRRERAELLLAYLERHGADRDVVAQLLAEPLNASIRARLQALSAPAP
jgi:hypothetical protein